MRYHEAHGEDASARDDGYSDDARDPSQKDTKWRRAPLAESGTRLLSSSYSEFAISRAGIGLHLLLLIGSVIFFIMLWRAFIIPASCVCAAAVKRQGESSTSDVPQYFQTVPELFPGQNYPRQNPACAQTD